MDGHRKYCDVLSVNKIFPSVQNISYDKKCNVSVWLIGSLLRHVGVGVYLAGGRIILFILEYIYHGK